MKLEQMKPVYGKEEKEALMKYMDSGAWLMEHKKTRELEKMLADFVGVKYCDMVPNGTLSLSAGLVALGVKPGDEVIVPDHTIIASATCASFIGAKPVFCDVETDSCAIDAVDLANKITNKTKAIVLVSICGRQARDWDIIFEIAEEHGIPVLEDSAQALGSYYDVGEYKQHIGTIGHVGSFSFSMSKIITMGCGGAVVTDDEKIHEEVKFMKNFGRYKGGMDINYYPGIDMKFNDVQAVIGIEQMKKLPKRIKRKKEMFKLYRDLLEGTKGISFIDTNLDITTPWMVDIMVEERDKLQEKLAKNEISTRKYYPALHTQKPYENVVGDFPNSDYVSQHGLWLPSFISISDYEIEFVCDKIKEALK